MLSWEQFEILLADHLDGVLAPEERAADRAAFEAHRASCRMCAELAEDASSAVAFMEIAADVEPPPALMTKILHATNAGWELKLRGGGVRGWINRTLAPVLRPRLVMGAMMTLMSVTMLSRCAGAPKKILTAADLDPVRLWTSLDDRTNRMWDRTMKSYESMRLVYEIRNQISDWKQQQTDAEEAAAESSADSRKLNAPAANAPATQATQEKKK